MSDIIKENIPMPTATKQTRKCYANDLKKEIEGMIVGQCITIDREKYTTFCKVKKDFDTHDFLGFYIDDEGDRDNNGKRYRFWLKSMKQEFILPEKKGALLTGLNEKIK